MTFMLRKNNYGTFEPASEYDGDAASKVKVGNLIKCENNRNRNYANLQRYMVFISTLWDNMDDDMQRRFGTKDKFRKALEYLAGWRESLPRRYGTTIEIAASISFDAIKDETEFQEVFSKVIDAALEYFPSWTRADMQNLVQNEIMLFA